MPLHSHRIIFAIFLSVLASACGSSASTGSLTLGTSPTGAASPPTGAASPPSLSSPPIPSTPPSSNQEDLRAYMHGIGAVKRADGRHLIFFSSSGIPPRGSDQQGNWTHDIYVSTWGSADAKISTPTIFIQKPEAQEPLSVAQTTDGHVMVSFEDGWNTLNEVNQRYGVYDANLQPIASYPLDVASGGHSGHVTAVGQNFVVFYSDGWIKPGGVDNLGTGNGVYAKVFDSQGKVLRALDIAPDAREWWPMIAGSPSRALLVWQQFVPGQLHANLKIAVLNPQTGTMTDPRVLQTKLQYYTYNAEYVASIDRFIVVGTTFEGNGFAYLIDSDGQTTATLSCMPATVREAGIVVNQSTVYTPSQDNRLLHLKLTPSLISLTAVQQSPLNWSYIGNVGLMRNPFNVHWVSLTQTGVQEADFDLTAASAPKLSDRCL